MAYKDIPGRAGWQFKDDPANPGNKQTALFNKQNAGIRTTGLTQIYTETKKSTDPDGKNRGEVSATFYNKEVKPASFFSSLPSVGGGGVADPFFANVIHLINATGTVNGISADYASDVKGNPVSANNGVQSEPHDGITKFQSFAMEGNGSSETITSTNTTSGGTLGAGEYTVECWCYPRADANYKLLSTSASPFGGNTSGIALFMEVTTNELKITTGGIGQTATVGTPILIGEWNHVAVTRDASNTSRIYVNGAKGKEFLDSRNYQDQIVTLFDDVYNAFGGTRWNGYIEDFRVTKGVARYTENTLTIPTEAFPTS